MPTEPITHRFARRTALAIRWDYASQPLGQAREPTCAALDTRQKSGVKSRIGSSYRGLLGRLHVGKGLDTTGFAEWHKYVHRLGVWKDSASWQCPQPTSGTSTGPRVRRQEAETSTPRPSSPSKPGRTRASRTKFGQALAITMRGTRHFPHRSGAQVPPAGVRSIRRHSWRSRPR